MKFVYSPEGATPKEWPYSPGKLMSPEAEAIEKATGMTFGEWAEAVQRDSVRAIHALLWVLLKRDDPTLQYAAVQFSMDEVAIVFDAVERRNIRNRLRRDAKAGTLSVDGYLYLETLEEDAEILSLPPLDDEPDPVSADVDVDELAGSAQVEGSAPEGDEGKDQSGTDED